MSKLSSVPSHSPSIVTRKTGNEYILVPVTNNIADMDSVYTLNDSGAFIWECIDGKRDIEEIIGKLTDEYDIDRETAINDVIGFMDRMKQYLIIM